MSIREMEITKLEYLGSDSSGQHVFRGWTGSNQLKLIRTKQNPNYAFIKQSEVPEFKEFIATNKSFATLQDDILVTTTDDLYVFGRVPVARVEFSNDQIMKTVKDALGSDFQLLEYLDPTRRVRIDNSLRVPDITKLPVAGFDIEVDARAGFPEPKLAEQRMLGIGIIGTDGHEEWLGYDKEAKDLQELTNIVVKRKYRMMTGWNMDAFDKPYMRKRAEKLRAAKELKEDFSIPGVSWVDAMKLYQSTEFCRGKSARLADSAKRELNREIKEEFAGETRKMDAMYNSFIKHDGKVGKYCIADAKACLDILMHPKLQLTDMFLNHILNISSCDFEESTMPSRLVEGTVFKEAQSGSQRLIFPSEGHYDPDQETFKGGHVVDPLTGLWDLIVVFDFKSLYNRIMQSWNIGLDSYVSNIKHEEFPLQYAKQNDYILTPSGALYTQLPSVYRNVLRKLETMRNFYKTSYSPNAEIARTNKTLDNSYKMILLSVWGVLGMSSGRLFSKPVAESIAAGGRWCLLTAIEFFNSIGCDVVYGDTDSCLVHFKGITDPAFLISNIIPLALDQANAYIKKKAMEAWNIPEDFYCIQLEFEKVYHKFYIPAKKRYIGQVIYKDGHVCYEQFTRGFEIAKFSVFDLYKTVQKDIFNIVFKSDSQEEIVLNCESYMKDVHDKLFKKELDDKLVIRSGVHSIPTVSKASTATAQQQLFGDKTVVSLPCERVPGQPYMTAARKLMAQGMFRKGDIVQYVIVDNDKFGLNAEPVISTIPTIRYTGYTYYWNTLSNFVEDILTRKGGVAYSKMSEYPTDKQEDRIMVSS